MVIVADGTDDAARRLERVLWNDPATGVMRHADAGYEIAIDCAREQGLDLPMVTSDCEARTPKTSSLGRLAADLGLGAEAQPRRCRRCSASPTPPRAVERIVAGGETVYGVNTGFGLLANTRIPDRAPCRAADQPDPLAQRRPRRPASAPRHAADDRPEAARPRPRLFGRSPAGDRGACSACSMPTRCR